MTTHLIIDGYNLLGTRDHRFGSDCSPSEFVREQLIRDLASYRHRKGHAITVVFDGWQGRLSTEQREHRAGVEVIYSRRGERADQVIQRLAAEFGRNCAVVSSDHEVVNAAKAQGAFVLSVLEFKRKLSAMPASSTPSGRKSEDECEEIPKRNPEKKGNPRKLPKALRKRHRQLKGF